MLLRVYRVTDKIGIMIVKTGSELSALILENTNSVLESMRTGTSGILQFILSIIAILLWFVRKIRSGLVWLIQKLLSGLMKIINLLNRLGGNTTSVSNRVGKLVRGSASNTMARRSARAEMEAGLAEDPLRSQNRMLSAIVVVILITLIYVVIWATTNQTQKSPISETENLVASGVVNPTAPADNNNFTSLDIPTAVPTAIEVPAVLQAGGSIAYVARERGQTDIWAVPVGSRNPIRITNSPEDERDPAWSHDGTRIAYASRQEDNNWDIYIYNLLTEQTTRMTFNLAFEARPKWSPDDQFLVYESYQNNTHIDIFIMRVDGTEAPIALGASSNAPDFSPAWSPGAGREIAFVSWRDGNKDIYIFSLETQETYNLTNTPNRHEDFPAWSPDGNLLAFSAIENGYETIFVQEVSNLNTPAQAFRSGRTPAWSPTGESIVFTNDTSDKNSTLITVAPFVETSVATEVIQTPYGSSMPVWTDTPLPAALINSGGLPLGVENPLYEEQVLPTGGDPSYNLGSLINITGVEPAFLSDRVNDSFNAMRIKINELTGVDFLGRLSDALWDLDRRPQPGEPNRNWHRTGRAFSFVRTQIVGFPAPIEIIREDREDGGLKTFWRVYVRVAEEAQTGQLGEPLRDMPWDFQSIDRGDVEAYEQGGRLRDAMPSGYYVDVTQVMQDYGWERVASGTDWRGNRNATNYWMFVKSQGLDWYAAMREIYAESQLGGWAPTPTTQEQ